MPLDPRTKRLLDMLALGTGRPSGRMSAADRRVGFQALMALSRPSIPMHEVENRVVEGPAGPLPVRLYVPLPAERPAPGLVFFHGGGLVAGDLETHDALCRRLAQASRGRVVAVDYRLAPEHPFPAAPEDALAAMRAVADGADRFGLDAGRLGVGGDSAGGTLATIVAGSMGHRLRFQLLLCPVLDLAKCRPSRHVFGVGYMLDKAIMDRDLADYLPGGGDPADPRVSPIRARDLGRMPPTLLHTAEFDPLRDEGSDYAAMLTAAGVAVRHTEHPGMIHHFLGLEGVLPQARQALAAIGEDMRAAWA